jgi:hypothetical protein
MTLCFEEQQTEDQVAETLAAVGFEYADVSQTIGAVLPPDAAGSSRDPVLINEGVPAEGVKIVGAAAEDGCADREDSGGEVFAGSEPFSLNHMLPFFRGPFLHWSAARYRTRTARDIVLLKTVHRTAFRAF